MASLVNLFFDFLHTKSKMNCTDTSALGPFRFFLVNLGDLQRVIPIAQDAYSANSIACKNEKRRLVKQSRDDYEYHELIEMHHPQPVQFSFSSHHFN
jgi:hypothetical protein